ncbi:MAG: uncharacterized membrane protein YebE (DUF533 family) [Myxococcota bacterium]|jgi:uncharacterized membrane protein YebE (DUF533 family)
MDWLEDPVELDAPTAAAIALAMRAVAQADGMVHPREMALVAEFERGLPSGIEPAAQLSPAAARTLLRSVIMVALADGNISEAEHVAIAALSAEHGLEDDALDELVLSVKRDFLDHFAGRTQFRGSVIRVAEELGLDDDTLAAFRGVN